MVKIGLTKKKEQDIDSVVSIIISKKDGFLASNSDKGKRPFQ